MADPFEAFSDAFNQSMGRERELANKMKMLKYQSNLEAQQPTPEMRLFELFKSDPENFKAYMRAKDPLDAFYKQGMLNYYMGNLGLEREKMKYMMDQGTNKQRDYNFLMQQPGIAYVCYFRLISYQFRKRKPPEISDGLSVAPSFRAFRRLVFRPLLRICAPAMFMHYIRHMAELTPLYIIGRFKRNAAYRAG
jgi:hypothetical protein